MVPRHEIGVMWLPRSLAWLLLLVVLYSPGAAHLFPASESTKPAATVQPPGTVTTVMVTWRQTVHPRGCWISEVVKL